MSQQGLTAATGVLTAAAWEGPLWHKYTWRSPFQMKRQEFEMKIEVEAKIQEEGTGVFTSWVWQKNNGH